MKMNRPEQTVSPQEMKRILLVEEDQRISEKVNFILDGKFEVVRMKTGEEAIRAFQGSRFDLVFMDLKLAGMTGYETARRIRDLERAGNRRPVPIVAFTAQVTEEDRRRFPGSGIDDYLAKPFFMETIFPTLYRNLEKTPIHGLPSA